MKKKAGSVRLYKAASPWDTLIHYAEKTLGADLTEVFDLRCRTTEKFRPLSAERFLLDDARPVTCITCIARLADGDC